MTEIRDRLPRCREAVKHRVGQFASVIALRHECTAVEDEKHEQHTTAEARASLASAHVCGVDPMKLAGKLVGGPVCRFGMAWAALVTYRGGASVQAYCTGGGAPRHTVHRPCVI